MKSKVFEPQVRTEDELESMRASGKIVKRTLGHVASSALPDVTVRDLGELAREAALSLGAQSDFPFEGYGSPPFPGPMCISLNEEVVHGIPTRNIKLKDGDIVSLDFGVRINDMITDSALTFIVGRGTPRVRNLLRATETALWAGIEAVREGVTVGDVGHAIFASHQNKPFSSVYGYGGHGVGRKLHELPHIPNLGPAGTGPRLVAGQTIALEPMLTMGSIHSTVGEDGWTVYSDGLSAHFEHTVLVTETGYEVLT